MTLRNWQGPGGTVSSPISGDFLTAGNWQGGAFPGPGDDANFGNSGTYTVSFSGTASVGELSGGGSTSTFDLASGDLALSSAGVSNWTGVFDQSGGTLAMASNGLGLTGTFDQTAGTILLGTGVRLSSGSMTLAGTLIGGVLDTSATLDGAIFDVGAILGATLTLVTDESFAGNLISAGSIGLGGHMLTLTGISPESVVTFNGPGTADVQGTLGGDISVTGTGGLLMDAGVIVDDRALLTSGSLEITAGATFDIIMDSAISVTTADTATNLGLLEKTVATVAKTTQFAPALISSGTLLVAAGTIQLAGIGSELGGTIDGEGMVQVTGTATLEPGVSIAAATTLAIAGTTGLLVLGASMGVGDVGLGTGTLALAGSTLMLQGQGSLDATLLAPGSLIVAGSYGVHGLIATGGTVAIEDDGTIIDGGGVQLGIGTADHVGLQIDVGASYVIAAAGTMFTATTGGINPHGQVINAGLFTDTAGGTYKVVPSFTNEAGGTLLAGAGTLSLAEGLVNNGTGTVDSVLTVAGGLLGAGSLVIGADATVSVTGTVGAGSTLDFAGAAGVLVIGTPSLFAGTVVNFAAGDTLDLTGVKANQSSYTGGAGALTLSNLVNGTLSAVATIAMAGGPGAVFVTGDGSGGTKIIAQSPGSVFAGPTVTPVPQINWKGGSGDFANAALWTGGVPSAAVDATMNSAGSTVTVDGADTIDALGSTNISLDVTGGALIDDNAGHWYGSALIGGGTFESVTGFTFGGSGGAVTNVGTGGVLQSDSGTLTVTGTLSVAGTLAGPGVVRIDNGTLTLAAGSAINVGTLLVDDIATLDPYAGETISSALLLTAGTLTLAGGLSLAGRAQLNGSVTNSGSIVIAPAASTDVSALTLNGTADQLFVQGIAAQTTGDVKSSTAFGASATIDISAGATWDIGGDDNILLHTGAGVLVNGGLLEKSAGSGTSNIQAHLISTGTLLVNTGTVTISAGGIELGGTVVGAGELATVATPGSVATTLDSGLVLAVATFDVGNPLLLGDQTYFGDYISTGTATLQGHALTLSGQVEWSGGIAGPGTVDITGSADTNQLVITGIGVTLAVAGTMTNSSVLALGQAGTDVATLAIGSGGSYELTSDSEISATGTANIVNAGLFAKVGGFGTSDIAAPMRNTGTVLVAHAALDFQAPLSNDAVINVNGGLVLNAALGADAGQSGTINLTPSGTLTVGSGGSVASSESVSFDPGGLVALANGVGFAGKLENFGPGDSIELIGTTATAVDYIGGAIVLSNGTTTLETIAAPGIIHPANLLLNTDGQGNSWLVELACFASGTRILTASGEVPVEVLRVGDLVTALASGGLRRIRWIGSRTVDCRRHPRPQEVWPVRVGEGAFAPGVPARDLLLSLDHAVAIDGVLIPIRHFVNGTSITREAVTEITYWHIELDAHDIVLAEGVPAESFLDTGNRGAFAGGRMQRLHPDFAERTRETRGCLPLAVDGGVVERVRAAVQARANTIPRASQQPTSTAATRPASSRRKRNVQSPGAE